MKNFSLFHKSLLHPRYWLIWLGIIFFYFLVLLPYPILYYLGIFIGRCVPLFIPNRVKIAKINLDLCFPKMSILEKKIFLKKNLDSVGIGIIETCIAWFWPDWRIKRLFKIKGFEHIEKECKHNRGILLIGLHFLTLELGARMLGILHPGIGIYRPNDNILLDKLQTWGRLRSNKSMINRKDIKSIIRALKNGEMIWYAPDHDYGPKGSVFVPFFSVSNAATTSGTNLLIRITNPAIITFIPRRLSNFDGYELLIFPKKFEVPLNSKIATAVYINKIIEQIILLAPEQYMWLHRRFKTRPFGEISPYL